MLRLLVIFHVLLFAALPQSGIAVKIQLTAADGEKCQVIGSVLQNWIGEPYYAFRGIPYATPPLGALRFRDPQPLINLPSTIDARYDGHDCHSVYATNASEDCLTLNVYSSQLTSAQSLPVLVFIHPGGLYVGSGLSSFLGPEYLLSKPLVLVTFNYRLGTLGFLNLGSPTVPGNAGFKDQALALRWVHTHIANFGGNPNDITLMGYSAGALSVSLHLVSPLSQGLFHKAIVMSGALPPQQPQQQQQYELAIKQAELVGCHLPVTASEAQLLECLNSCNGSQLAGSLRGLFDFGKDNPMYLWLPLAEASHGQQQFLSTDFYGTLRAGNFSPVPLLVGYNNGEFCTSAAEIMLNATLLRQLRDNFAQLAPKIFMYKEQQGSRISAALEQRYLHSHNAAEQWNFSRLCDLFSDALTRFGAQRLARFAAAAQAPVFSYEFAYLGQHSQLAYAAHWGKARVEHLDDLMYLFRMPPHTFKPDEEEAHIVRIYVNFIYEFMRTGELRTAEGLKSSYPSSYALITDQVAFVNGTQFAEAQFWEELFP